MMAEPLARYLDSRGHCVYGQTGFVGTQPDSPDDCVTLFDETAPTDDDSNVIGVDVVGVQVTARSTGYASARERAWAIHRDIVGFGGELWSGFPRVEALLVVTPPSSIGRDEQDREEFTAHYGLRIESAGDQFRQ